MPPDNGAYEENLDMVIFDNFDNELSKVLGVEVVWEDREFFNIPSPKKDTIDILKKYLENFWKKLSANKTTKEIPLQINTEQPSLAITLKSLKKELEDFYFNYFELYNYKYARKENTLLIELNEVILTISFSFIKIGNSIFGIQSGMGLSHTSVDKYINNCNVHDFQIKNYPVFSYFPTYEEKESLNFYIRTDEKMILYLKNLKLYLDNRTMPVYTKYSTLASLDFEYNNDNGIKPFLLQNDWEELVSIIICCLTNNPNRFKILNNRLKKITDNIDIFKKNYNIYLFLDGLMQDNLILEEEFKYYVKQFNIAK
ncbi:MAG: hypothetical protein IPG55_06370 [Saprospiraceae bacterium]|nr:hypothetical protein [Candidatus Defluviibacterium haderslevense]